jgi:sugar/nucleoside kinase (ribokinase family)
MEGRLDIVGFGSVSLDEILYVDCPLSNGKGRIVERRVDHGGNVGTALVAAAALGARAGFVGWLSSAPSYASVSRSLAEHGVDITRCSFSPTADPICATVIVGNDGERFIAYSDASAAGPKENLVSADWQGASVLLVDSHAASSLDAVRLAVNSGLDVVADIEWSSGPETLQLMSLTHHLVLPWEFAVSQSGTEDPHRMLESLWSIDRRSVVVTHGIHGAYVRSDDDGTRWHVPAHAMNAVDTTGCGDWFHGAYAVALARGSAALERVRFATAAAGIAAEGRGGRGKLATRDAVERLMTQAGASTALHV